MNTTFKRYLVSSLTTFLSIFLPVLGTQISMAGEIEFSYAFFAGITVVALRAAVKGVIEAIPTFGSADKR